MAKNIRTAQLLTPFGIGQIVNFPNEVSLMIGGLDLWEESIERATNMLGQDQIDRGLLIIREKRLEKLLKVEYFFKPFPYKTSGINRNLSIPGARFPQWHYCSKITCGRMTKVQLTFAVDRKDCPDCHSRMLPIRFIAACRHGHIQDVPFKEWVHNGPVNDNNDHILKYKGGTGAGDLSSIQISCSCGEKKNLAGLMNVWRDDQGNPYNSALARIGLDDEKTQKYSPSSPNNLENNPRGQFCKGYRPWLGTQGGINNAQDCGEHLQVLIRGGSNVHYSDIISSLYLPECSETLSETIKGIIEQYGIETIKLLYNQDTVSYGMLRRLIINNNDFQTGANDIEVILPLLVEEILKDTDTCASETENDSYNPLTLRKEEYDYILKGRDSEDSDFKAVIKDLSKYNNASFLKNYFEKVVLVEKLKETRVFRGFARINPNNRIDKSELSNKQVNWLPAYQVSGEGIFLKFKDEVIDQWLEKNNSGFDGLITRYTQAMSRRNPLSLGNPRNIDRGFVMMHTFAHLLIKRLCYSCGYGSSALRERIYFSNDPDNRMNGILIYTSSGDSEGSLGGLVRQGTEPFLANIVRQAIEEARWCSADPVCSDIGQSSGQGPDNINGSACHNCCLVPETSCEEFNMLLDRATITGTLNDPQLGFFS